LTDHLVILLTKFPVPGSVKTRLAATLGDIEACKIHDRLVQHCLSANQSPLWDFQVHYAGGSLDQMTDWIGQKTLVPQCSGDLGARISGAFLSGFAQGYKRICVIGSDIPELSSKHITQAFKALDVADLSVGPTEDGGYYLIALKAPHSVLFETMPWSTSEIFDATLDKAQHNQLAVHVGDMLEDVDHFEDWQKLAPLLGK